jgi:class 3 adenylate cyclase
MTGNNSTPKEPMSKDTSCINIHTCENYLKNVLPAVPYDKLFDGIIGNWEFLFTDQNTGKIIPVDKDYLLNLNNWVSNKLLSKVYENTVSILNDPDAIYKAGRNIFETTVGSQIFLMRFAGVQTIINRLPKENAKFNQNRTITVVENQNGYAVVRISWDADPSIKRLFCDMNRGVYEGLGRLTRNPAKVEEKICQFNGADYCEYHIKWKAKPFHSRIVDLCRFRLSHEVIDELERMIEAINEIRLKQERIIKLRTADLEEEKEKVVHAHSILSSFVAPQLAEKILDGEVDPVWGHHRKKLTMFFSDIKDFTPITESMEPEDMANLLNEYFSNMNAIIQKYGGTLANINGDALFVFFGAPDRTNDRDHALRCVNMAIDMQCKMTELQQKWFEEGIEQALQIRCGISTGMATVGGFGSGDRKAYTAMGMQVNLASRLESACEPGGILIGHPTWALVKTEIECEPRGQIEVKGFSRPVRAYAVKFRKQES